MNEDKIIPFVKSENAKGESARFFEIKKKNGFYDKYIRPGIVLDIGYKGGKNYDPLFEDCIGLDIDTPGYNGRDFPFQNNSVGTVLCSHVLEHIADYTFFLQEIFRVLKPKGTAILSVPLKDIYERKDVPPSRFNSDHKRFYTSSRLFYEIETSIPRTIYKILFCEEHFIPSDFYLPENYHARNAYEIECVLEKNEIVNTSNEIFGLPKNLSEEIICGLYKFFLFRTPDPLGLHVHSSYLSKSRITSELILDLLLRFSSSDEFNKFHKTQFINRLSNTKSNDN